MNYDEERKIREKLQMEVDSKDAEIEGFQQKLAAIYEGQSISSGNDDGGGGSPLDDTIASFNSFQINQVWKGEISETASRVRGFVHYWAGHAAVVIKITLYQP